MSKRYVKTTVDDINLNARHFVKLGREKATEELLQNNPDKKEDWAEKAFDQMTEDVDKVNAEKDPVPGDKKK